MKVFVAEAAIRVSNESSWVCCAWGLPTAEKVARHHGGDSEADGIRGAGAKAAIRFPDR